MPSASDTESALANGRVSHEMVGVTNYTQGMWLATGMNGRPQTTKRDVRSGTPDVKAMFDMYKLDTDKSDGS